MRLIPLLCLSILLAACTRNEVKLTFQVGNEVNSPCRIIYYASDKKKGMFRETAVDIRAGKGEITLPERNPSLFYLVSSSQSIPAAVFYAERGDELTVSGDGDDMLEWKISGNKISDELSSWRIKNADILRGNDSDKINKAVKDYVESHKDSPAALILLYIYFNRRDNETEFFSLQAKFDKKILDDEELMGVLSVSDLMTGLTDKPSFPSELVLKGMAGKADTLKIKGSDGYLLIFKDQTIGDEDLKPDSLGRLAEKHTWKGVAEIWMGNDSMAWRRYVNQDSIDTIVNIHRVWMPLGPVDRNALEIGVRRVPYFIVIDAKGKELYRGDSSEEAIEKFENIR